jgi:general secretion pathway protein G
MKLKNKGFTLIELMIVVVILGVLMSTVLPKLTGAQARARDTGRIADLGNISASLTTYYDDNGEFPSTVGCLKSGHTTNDAIKIYLEGSKVPADPQKNANTFLCNGDLGLYWYQPVIKAGIANNAFILCADMETFQKANTDASNIATTGSPATLTDTAYATNSPFIGVDIGSELANAAQSVYCILRP